MHLIDDAGTGEVPCGELTLSQMKTAAGGLAGKILELLALHPGGLHSSAIARQLRVHEQNIYYHTQRLRKAGLLVVHHTEDGRGGTAKVLALKDGAFAVRLVPFSPLARIGTYLPEHTRFLFPFVSEGRMMAKIVVGSPDPHGPEQARSRDANYAIDIGLFLGTFLTTRAPPSVVLDTELRDWNQNLIIIGGPVVNKAAERINLRSTVPYDRETKVFRVGNRQFGFDEVGIIAKMPNPFAKGKWILHITGKRHTGTKAAILALLTQFDRVCRQDITVVEGMDADSDGIIDSVKIVEIEK